MPDEIICPGCGLALWLERPDDANAVGGPAAGTRTVEVVIPATASFDGLGPRPPALACPEPDPILGAFVADDPGPSRPEAAVPAPGPIPTDARSVLAADLLPAAPDPRLTVSAVIETRPASASAHRRRSWPVVLLGLYAVAATIGCAWLWWAARDRDRDRPPSPPGVAAGPGGASR